MLGVTLPLPVSEETACGHRCIYVDAPGSWGWVTMFLPSLPEYVTPTDPCRFAALSPSTSLWY